MYNNEFKNIDTQHKAYLLGLAYADGCISNNTFKINLAEDDVYILMNIQREFQMLNLNYIPIDIDNNKNQYALRKHSAKCCKDLELNGLLPAKSRQNNSLLQYPNIDKKFDKDFIRGLFDGDGSINIPRARPLTRELEIGMVNELFIQQLQSKLKEYNIELEYREKEDKKNNRLKRYILKSQNYSNINKFGNFIYQNSLIHLYRKKYYFDTLQDPEIRIQTIYNNNPTCPYCFSNATTKNGKRKIESAVKIRYKCRECMKGFSI